MTPLTTEAAQARLTAALGDRAPRVTETSGENAYKIAGSDRWRSFPTPLPPERPTRVVPGSFRDIASRIDTSQVPRRRQDHLSRDEAGARAAEEGHYDR